MSRPTDPAVDFIDPKIGGIDFKGPLRHKDGSAMVITDKVKQNFANSIIKEVNMSTASKAVVVDTLGLSKQEIQWLKNTVSAGIKTKKQIIYLE